MIVTLLKKNNTSLIKCYCAIIILLIISINFAYLTPVYNSSAIPIWTLDEKEDFENATLENLQIDDNGNIRLDYQTLLVEDNFDDLSKVGYNVNVTWDENKKKISLETLDNVFFTTMGMYGDE